MRCYRKGVNEQIVKEGKKLQRKASLSLPYSTSNSSATYYRGCCNFLSIVVTNQYHHQQRFYSEKPPSPSSSPDYQSIRYRKDLSVPHQSTVPIAITRRKWESSIGSMVHDQQERLNQRILKDHERVYKLKDFTPVETAFPLSNPEIWGTGKGGGGGGGGGAASFKNKTSAAASTTSSFSVEGGGEKREKENRREEEEQEVSYVTKVGILGPPNAGKSSLTNALIGDSISAVSKKEGTTKEWIKGVSSVHNTQLVFLDTPGVFHVRSPKDRSRHLNQTHQALDALYTADILVIVLSVGLGYIEAEHKAVLTQILRRAEMRELPVVLALTKVDTVTNFSRQQLYFSLRSEIEANPAQYKFSKIFEVSAKNYRGVLELKDYLCLFAKKAQWKYVSTQATDMNEAERCAEILSQALFQSLPAFFVHDCAHRIIGWTQKTSFLLIDVEMFFERPAHMHIFLGKQFAIRMKAKREMEMVLKKKVELCFHKFVSPGSIRPK